MGRCDISNICIPTRRIVYNSVSVIREFISLWNIPTNNSSITLPLVDGATYNMTVDWGDDSQDTITVWNQAQITHTYATADNYTVKITGVFGGFRFGGGGSRLRLSNISQWGPYKFFNTSGAFHGCNNLTITAVDIPDFSGVTSFGGVSTFQSCFALTTIPNIERWDTSNCTSMNSMFFSAIFFNQDLNGWDVSNVTVFQYMFASVTGPAMIFNGLIDEWDVSAAVNMSNMFAQTNTGTNAYNRPLNNWGLRTANVEQMDQMFRGCRFFNQDLDQWNTQKVTTMRRMFSHSSLPMAFNGDVTTWGVGAVTDMFEMFMQCTSFNQDLSGWSIINVTTLGSFMPNSTLSTVNYDALLIAWAELALKNNVPAHFGSSKYSAGAATTARDDIISTFTWTITDGGQV